MDIRLPAVDRTRRFELVPTSRVVASALMLLVFAERSAADGAPTSEKGTGAAVAIAAAMDHATPPNAEVGRSGGTATGDDFAWVALGGEGPVARAIVESGNPCPPIEVDAQPMSPGMRVRTDDPPRGFESIRVCELLVADTTRTVTIGSHPTVRLPDRTSTLGRVVVIGDTGCRSQQQVGCETTGEKPWLFPAVARAAAAEKPALIVHVGDYHYREKQDTRCESDPSVTDGDCWASWKADFFAHAGATGLLTRAPWVFARGNHETCDAPGVSARAWRGWYLLLDTHAVDPDNPPWTVCDPYSSAYKLSVGRRDLWVMDSSALSSTQDEAPRDRSCPASRRGSQQRYCDYVRQLGEMNDAFGAQGSPPGWLVLHHPFWAMTAYGTVSDTLRAAWQEATTANLESHLEVMLAGHIHLFEYLSFDDARPAQLIFGGGGTALERHGPRTPPESYGTRRFLHRREFGFGVIEADATGGQWRVEVQACSDSDGHCDAAAEIAVPFK